MLVQIKDKTVTEKDFQAWKDELNGNGYQILKAINGANYVNRNTVVSDVMHISEGNEKTGEKVVNFNLPVEYTCNHTCECYTEKKCYAEGGCYMWGLNQAGYSENYNFIKTHTNDEIVSCWQYAINKWNYKLWRFFTCGDIPSYKFIDCMVKLANNNPEVKFWTYTKKYGLINIWIKEHGTLPENLVIIFSHWMNEDGSYFPMSNPYNFPTSEFIPFGKEHLKETVTHICPCSDPEVKATCATCDHPCYELKHGESMALLEHSTSATVERDNMLKKAHKALKAAKKAK